MWIREAGKITEGFYILGTGPNPVYLVECGGEWVLVEGGIEANASLVLEQLKRIVPDISLVKYWFITHSHYDHCGGIEKIYRHFPGITLYASGESLKNFGSEKYIGRVRHLNSLVLAGPPADAVSDEAPDIALNEIPFAEIGDKSVVVTGKEEWMVFHTPGHSRCSLSLYNKSRKILFVSDAFGEIISGDKWFPLAFESMNDFINSILRLSNVDADYVALGHYGVLEGEDARNAGVYALQSCYRMIGLVDETTSNEGAAQVPLRIEETFGENSKSFVPPHVFTKSIAQLIQVLKSENYVS